MVERIFFLKLYKCFSSQKIHTFALKASTMRISYGDTVKEHIVKSPSFVFEAVMALPQGAYETLDDIPAHVWKGLPNSMKLGPSAVNPNRIGE